MTNEAMRENWASAGTSWVRNEAIFDAAFRPFTDAVVRAAELHDARRVLDVGCGSGTLLEIATAAGAAAVGVDISPVMVDAARRRVPTATIVQADAQSDDLASAAPGEPFDRVVSRFGVMFFADPVAALANLRAAAAPGAKLAFVAWRDDDVDTFLLGLRSVVARLDPPIGRPPAGLPGPLGFAHAERIDEVLRGSGWSDISIERLDAICDYSTPDSDGVEERLAAALSGTIGRAAQERIGSELGADGWNQALDDARRELRERLVDGALRFEGRTWLVSAAAP